MNGQFMTTCRKCGRPILMKQCRQDGHWIPCDPESKRFLPSGGPETYVNDYGKLCRGIRDRYGETGYKRHFITCEARYSA